MNAEFQTHILTPPGLEKACLVAEAFDECLEKLKELCPEGRELSICKTKMEEACFFAKKSMVKANSQPA